jgi:hypothetical protein
MTINSEENKHNILNNDKMAELQKPVKICRIIRQKGLNLMKSYKYIILI